MQILHPFMGTVAQYSAEISDPDRYRPDHCPQCEAHRPLTAHGFYRRTLVNVVFDGTIRVRRYLCHCCKRTVSLLPDFALPYIRFGITVISFFLIARLLIGRTLAAASTLDATIRAAEGDKTAKARKVGELLAQRAAAAGIAAVVFDRGGYRYHGRVAALADGAREGGLRL